MKGLILCVDIGTTSLKTAIISSCGEVVVFSRRKLEKSTTHFAALEWLEKLSEAALSFSVCTENIEAICISGNGPTIVSENGRTILWNHSNEFYNTLQKTKSLYIPKISAFIHFFPKDYENTKFLFSGPEFLVWQLTENAVTLLPEKRYEEIYWTKDELKKFKIDFSKIPKFIEPCISIGTTTLTANKKLNLKSSVPVFCTGPDFIAALIGTNTLKAGRLCDRAGSSEGINLCTQTFVKAASEKIRVMPSVVSDLWNISTIIPESGIKFSRYKDEICKLSDKKISYNQLIDDSFEDKNSEGWKILSELKSDFAEKRRILKEIAGENNIQIENTAFVSGGQAENSKWMQEKAHSAKINLGIVNIFDAELLGNAITASAGLGFYKNIQEAADKLVKVSKVFNCNEKNKKNFHIYKIPKNLKTIIFDIDSTLYTNEEYAIEQVDIQIRHFAKKNAMSPAQARNTISEFRKNWKIDHNGKTISLGNALTYFGVPIEESIEMRKKLLEPKKYLLEDKRLQEILNKLKQKYNLICVTNNPVLPAKKTLDALGVSSIISKIIGLDTCNKSKPAKEPFLLAAELTNSNIEECLSIGDRYDMDISLPLELGMGAILVEGVDDIYNLDKIL